MNVTQINLNNFRNFHNFKLNDLKRVNVIIGDNGTGKTSIIESIYICSVGKSFRTNNDVNIITAGKDNYKVKIKIDDSGKIKNLEVFYSEYGKKSKVNTSIKKRLSEFIGKYKVLLFSPDEIKILKDSPKSRRNYFNIQISQLERFYVKYLNEYNKILKQRNEYLRNSKINYEYLEILDLKLIDYGIKIFKYRKNYIKNLNNKIAKIQEKLQIDKEIMLNYVSDYEDYKNIEQKMKNSLEKDILYGMTRIGIHRDDIEFLFDGKNAKDFASQGQQKMILLVMKLAETLIFTNEYKHHPILLLDDLFSELDSKNQNKLIEFLGKKSQIFITTTDLNNIHNKKNINIIDLNKMEVNKYGKQL